MTGAHPDNTEANLPTIKNDYWQFTILAILPKAALFVIRKKLMRIFSLKFNNNLRIMHGPSVIKTLNICVFKLHVFEKCL